MKSKYRPPKVAEWLLSKMSEYESTFLFSGDLCENYERIVKESGLVKAKLWYWSQVIFSIIPYLKFKIRWGFIMFKNYCKIAYRNLFKYKSHFFINIFGLTMGIACFMIIILFIQHEWSYDRYHKNADRIYRIESRDSFNPRAVGNTRLQAPIASALMKEFPEVVNACRLWLRRNILISKGDKKFYEERFFYADPSVLDIFTFPLLKGDSEIALENPNSILITETMAKKYFAKDDPIGQELIIDNKRTYQVTGIFKDIPKNSHLRFDFFIPFSNLVHRFGNTVNEWNRMSAFQIYILLQPNYLPKVLELKLLAFQQKYMLQRETLYLKPLTSIHLHSHLPTELEPNSDIRYLYIFSTIAVLILIISCINFMNLATAKASNRLKEVWIRKTVGAYRWQLIFQFLSEAILLSFMALFLAILVVHIFLPIFNVVVQKDLAVDYTSIIAILRFVGIALFVGILAGSYPAFFLSSFQNVAVLKSAMSVGLKNTGLRKGLIVFQFTISIALIASTMIIYNQLNYIRKKNLGFKKEQMLIVFLKDKALQQKSEFIKRELLQLQNVSAVTASDGRPSKTGMETWFKAEGLEKEMWINTYGIDYDFINTYEMEITMGRNFSKDFVTDHEGAFLVNEAATMAFGWSNPINKKLAWFGKERKVIGVIGDFHFKSLHENIEPLIFYLESEPSELTLRLTTDDITSMLSYLGKKWEQLSPNYPLEYIFLNDSFDSLYRAEDRLGKIFGYFAILTIFIASLGLYGLAAFTAEQRTKEIGIRKVFGASISQMVLLITKEIFVLISIAILLGLPFAYYFMNRWLQDFAYKVELGLIHFLLTGCFALFLAMMTVSYHSLKAAFSNPVDALKYE